MRVFSAGDLRLMRAAVTGKHSLALTAMTEMASVGGILNPAIGEEKMELGVAGVDFVPAPVLHVAMTGNTLQHVEVAHFLIHSGADPVLSSEDINSAVTFAPSVMYTLGYEVKPNASRAAMLQKLVIAFPLKFDMQRVRHWALSSGKSLPLHCAVEARFYDGVYVMVTMPMLVPRFEYDPNEKDAHGNTALMLAAATGQADLMRLMIHNNVKVTHRDSHGRTALHHAAINGHTGAISAILTARKEVEVLRKLCELKDSDGRTALDLASLTPVRLPVVRALRAAMSPIGVVPHSAPWLAKPRVSDFYIKRNATAWLLRHGNCIRSSSVISESVLMRWSSQLDKTSRTVKNYANSSIDSFPLPASISTSESDLLFKNYISTKRPFLSVQSDLDPTQMCRFSKTFTDWMFAAVSGLVVRTNYHYLRSLTANATTGLNELGIFSLRSNDAWTDELKHAFSNGCCTDLHKDEQVIDENGNLKHGIKLTSVLDYFLETAIENLLFSKVPGRAIFLKEWNPSGSGLFDLLSSKWCDRLSTHSGNHEVVSIGTTGGLIDGSVPFYSHFHSILVTGVKLWCLFPSGANETIGMTHVEDMLKNNQSHEYVAEFLSNVLPKIKESVDIHTVIQYSNDIIYIPPGWSFLALNIAPCISVIWQNCMLDVSEPNCEVQRVVTPVNT